MISSLPILLSVIICFSLSAKGTNLDVDIAESYQVLVNEYLRSNFELKQSEANFKISALDYKKISAANSYYLNYSGVSTDDKTESSFTFKPNPNKKKSHTFSISKIFDFGTTINFEQNFQNYVGTSALGQPVAKTYGSYQKLSISQNLGQDFFGRNFFLSQKILKLKSNISKQNYNLKKESGILEFLNIYFNASLFKELVKLRSIAVQRSVARLALVTRRLRDGLAEKADKLQAKSSLMESKSVNEETKLNYINSLEQLSEKLHRDLIGSEVSKLEMQRGSNFKFEKNKKVEMNKQLQLYLAKRDLFQASLNKSKNDFLPKVNLSFEYLSNDYATTSAGDAFSTSIIGSKQNSKIIALNVSWPIGNEVEKIERQKAMLSKIQAELSMKIIKKNLQKRKKLTLVSIVTYSKKVGFQKKRISLARKNLKELNRMYSKGKVDFDQVIRAEESLIQTQSSYLQSVVDYKKAVLNLFFIDGNLEQKVKEGRI